MSKEQGEGIAPQAHISVTAERPRGKFRGALLAGAMFVSGVVAVEAADRLGYDIPSPVDIDGDADIEVGQPKVLKIDITGNLCPVTAEASVDVVGSYHQRVKVFGQALHTQTVIDKLKVHAAGEVSSCVAADDLDITLTQVPSKKPTASIENDVVDPGYAYKMNIKVGRIFAESSLTNLGQNNSVEGESLTGFGTALDSLFKITNGGKGIGEEKFPGILQAVGKDVLGSGICDPEVIEATEAGIGQTVASIANQVLKQVGEPGIIDERTEVEIRQVAVASDQAPRESSKVYFDKHYSDLPDGIEIEIADANCPTNFNLDPLPSGSATVRQVS